MLKHNSTAVSSGGSLASDTNGGNSEVDHTSVGPSPAEGDDLVDNFMSDAVDLKSEGDDVAIGEVMMIALEMTNRVFVGPRRPIKMRILILYGMRMIHEQIGYSSVLTPVRKMLYLPAIRLLLLMEIECQNQNKIAQLNPMADLATKRKSQK